MDPQLEAEIKALLTTDARRVIASIGLLPDDAVAAVYVGRAHLRLGELSAAEGQFRRAVAIDPQNVHAVWYSGVCAERQGRLPEAIAAFERVIQLQPSFKAARIRLGLDAPREVVREKPPATQQAVATKAPTRRNRLSLPEDDLQADEFREELIRAERAAFYGKMFGRPPWANALLAILIALVVAFIAWVAISGYSNYNRGQEDQCRFELKHFGTEDLPTDCRERLNLD